MAGEETVPQSPDAQHIEVSGGVPPPEEAAEGLGGVALDDGIIHDSEKARVMADASDELWTLAANLEQSGTPESVDFAKTLRERGNELAEKAKVDYEKEKADYEAARDFLVGRIVAIDKGEISEKVTLMNNRNLTVNGVNVGDGWVTMAQAEELRDLCYQVLGVEKPPEEDFKNQQSTNWWRVENASKTGMVISEIRHKRVSHEGRLEEEGVGTLVDLSIARSQESS